MNLEKIEYSVLIVSNSEKFNDNISPVLKEKGVFLKTVVGDGSTARRKILEDNFDFIIINSPLKDEFGTKLALDISAKSNVGILLLVKAEHFTEINSRLSQLGVMVLSKPTTTLIVNQSISLLCAMRQRIKRMEQKNATLEEKMEEIRIVNRAKWILIDFQNMDENTAHRFIEKTAMDLCKTKREVAKEIIDKFSV